LLQAARQSSGTLRKMADFIVKAPFDVTRTA
jgi:hypothetical protein